MLTYVALTIFLLAFLFIILDIFDKSLVALSGALLMVILGVLPAEEALLAVEYETILLLLSMMLVVNIASKSGIFEWLNVRIAAITKGNPLAIFILFSLLTGICSAFLDNVTTVILVVPLTIELLKGMGKDPKPYIFSEIIFANIGGGLTLIGDPSNIIIGGASGLSFMEFIQNLWIPVTLCAILTIAYFTTLNWKKLRPVSDNLVDLVTANIIIKKINYKFLKKTLHKEFIIKVSLILFLTFAGFVLQKYIGLPNYVIAFTAAILLGVLTSKRVNIHEAFMSIEWTTLFFFSGLFVMVAGVEATGLLDLISNWLSSTTTNLFLLSIMILWTCGILSMLIDNIPFVTVMVPVILGLQTTLNNPDATVLWWALSMGAVLGGNGTLIGASANVVTAGIARKEGVNISFLNYTKFSLPLTLGFLTIASIYLFFRLA